MHKKIIKRRTVKYKHLLNDREWFDFMNTRCLKAYDVSYMDECIKKRVSLPQISSIWHHLGKACTFHPCYVVNTTSSSIINLTVLASLWIKTVCVSYFKYINSITKGFIVKFSYIPEFLLSWPSHLPLFPFCLLLILWLFSNSLALTLFS